jgi:hypothetical protein
MPPPQVAGPDIAVSQLPVPQLAVVVDEKEETADKTPPRGISKWILAAVAALVVVVALFAVTRKNESAPVVHSGPAAAEPSQPTIPDVPKPSPLSPSPAVSSPTEHRLKTTPAGEPSATFRHAGARTAQGWSVIAASYSSQAAADKRVRSLSRQFPGFHIGVFKQEVDRAGFLVVLGQNLSEDDAEALRQRAVSAGLPKDTYIKRVE